MRLINRTNIPVWVRGFITPFGSGGLGLVLECRTAEVYGPPIPELQSEPFLLDGEVIVGEVGCLIPVMTFTGNSQTVAIRQGQITTLLRPHRLGGYEGLQLCHFNDDLDELGRRTVPCA